MSAPAERYRSILRYSYGLAGVVFGGAAIVIIALYLITRTESEGRNRVTSFHLHSTTHTRELINAVDTVIERLREDAALSTTATRSSTSIKLRPDISGIMQMIYARVALLQDLQDEFGGPEFEKTLARVRGHLDTIRGFGSLQSEPARNTFVALGLSLQQFNRLHVIAADEMLVDIAGVTTRRIPFLGILAIIIAVSALGLWIIVRALRATVDRQINAERALIESEKRMYHMQKLEALGQLVGGVAHDFNNLLTVILGQTGLLIDRAGDDERMRIGLAETREAARQAASLTNQLLTFGRRQVVAPIAFDLNELIKDIEPMLRRTIGEQIQLSLNCADEIDQVESIRDRCSKSS